MTKLLVSSQTVGVFSFFVVALKNSFVVLEYGETKNITILERRTISH